jgi:hypothetical protein
MRKLYFLIVLYFISVDCFATRQTPDILIYDRDTFYLSTFPLEFIRPVDTSKYFVSTNCWRGYKAVWTIENNKLYLTKLLKCNLYGTSDTIDKKDFFLINKINIKTETNKVFADWYTDTLVFYRRTKKDTRSYEYHPWGFLARKIKIKINKGIIESIK